MQIHNIENSRIFITAKFANLNKNNTLQKYQEEVKSGDYELCRCLVTDAAILTSEEYDDLTNSFLDDRDWLADKGGHNSDMIQPEGDWWNWSQEAQEEFRRTAYRLVIGVVCKERPTIYLDPQGYSYARYVGI